VTVVEPFELTSVVHLVRPAGRSARDLEELRSGLAEVPARSLFFHTVQGLLRNPAAEDPPPDDLSAWVNGVVQDRETAERLAFVVQSHATSSEALRAALLEVLDGIPPKARGVRDAPAGGEFVFLAADSVAIPTGARAAGPRELFDLLADADPGVWFYHLFEEPWFGQGATPLTGWLRAGGAERSALRVEECVAEGLPLGALRRRLLGHWRRSELRRRVAHAAGRPEEERRQAGRAAVAGLVRRLREGGEPS
jgi:hypothetical protein